MRRRGASRLTAGPPTWLFMARPGVHGRCRSGVEEFRGLTPADAGRLRARLRGERHTRGATAPAPSRSFIPARCDDEALAVDRELPERWFLAPVQGPECRAADVSEH